MTSKLAGVVRHSDQPNQSLRSDAVLSLPTHLAYIDRTSFSDLGHRKFYPYEIYKIIIT